MSKKDWWYFAVWEVQIRLRHFIVHKLRCTVSNQNGISDSWTITLWFCWGLERSSNYDVYQSRLFFLSEIRICLLKQILKYKNRKRKNRERVRTDIQRRFFDQSLLNLNNYNFNDESLVTSLISVSCHPQGAFLTMLIVTMTNARRTETISNWICRWTIFFLQWQERGEMTSGWWFLSWNFSQRTLVISLQSNQDRTPSDNLLS